MESLPTDCSLSPDVPQCHTVLAYLERDGHVLMMRRDRKPNDLNAGYWIGVGGKLEQGESALEALHREVNEELGVTLTQWQYRALIEFYHGTPCRYYERIYLFTSDKWDGEPSLDCPEGTLAWVPKEQVPRLHLWQGDRLFLKELAAGRPFFRLQLYYDEHDWLYHAMLDGVPCTLPSESSGEPSLD